CSDKEAVAMPVVTTFHLDDLFAPRIPPGYTYCRHCGLCSGVYHAHAFDRRDHACDKFRHLDLTCGGSAERRRACQCPLYCLLHIWEGMSKDHRSPGIDQIYVRVSVFVKKIGSLCALHKDGASTHSSEGTYRRVYTAGYELFCFLKKRSAF